MCGGDRSRSFLPAIISTLLIVSAGLAGASGSTRSDDIEHADAGRLRSHVEYLASDELGGRLVGTDGIARAEEYIAAQFESLGLGSLSGVDGYFQEFALRKIGFTADGSALIVKETGFVGSPGVNFQPFRYSAAGSVNASAVFAGFGITATYAGYDDYKDLDVDGKIAFLVRG